MKLATRNNNTRDGQLMVVNRAGTRWTPATEEIATHLQAALDDWERCQPKLEELTTQLEADLCPSEALPAHSGLGGVLAPLPRAYEWVDGSAFLNHVRLVRKARGAEPPPTLESDPLVYQGGSSDFLGPYNNIPLADVSWGLDFEGEICVVLGDTPQGCSPQDAEQNIRLVTLCNDVSLRGLIPIELAKGFGFFQSKPSSAFAPVAVTPDELGSVWRQGRLHLELRSTHNGAIVGSTLAGEEMHFSFWDLIAHISKTRAFGAGTILGSGTVSNADRSRGVSCLAERRMIEILDNGKAETPFMQFGDTIRMEVLDIEGRSVFGAIDQTVVEAGKSG